MRPGRTRLRTAGLLAAALLVWGVTGAGVAVAAPGAGSTTPTGAVPSAQLDAAIHTDQLDLVEHGDDLAVAAARSRLDAAGTRLAADRTALGQDQYAAVHAGAVQANARATVGREVSTLAAAVAAHHHAVDDVDTDRVELQGLAVGWYTGGASVTPTATASLASAQAAEDADTELTLLTHLTSVTLRADTKQATVTGIRVEKATTGVADGRAALAADVTASEHAAVVVSAARELVAAGGTAVDEATTTLRSTVAARAAAIAAFNRYEGAGPSPVPSILGPSAMTAQQIVAWFDAMGDAAGTQATIGQLASWYISEGRAEGVRGDIAFAQAMVETGGFDSPDAVTLNNYAGIGHCDSCSQGLRFGSALAGVRGQIQLLRTYADATLTSADLPSPPPLAVLAPQAQSVRGCCRTWNSLTGVWATDPIYGATVLGVYAEMVGYAAGQEAP